MKKVTVAIFIYVMAEITFFLYAIFYIPFLLIFGPVRIHYLTQAYGYFVLKAGLQKLKIIGHIPTNPGPYLFLANHQSLFDIFVVAQAMPYHTSVVVKKELLATPVLGFMLKRFDVIAIDRNDYRDSIGGMSRAVEAIKRGKTVFIFPEGTRSKTGKVGLFKKGSFKVAFDARATIVPISFNGSYDSKPYGHWLAKPNTITVNFGRPIVNKDYNHLSIDELSDLVRNKIIKLSLANDDNQFKTDKESKQ